MDNYVSIVFDNDTEAYAGLHALWDLDAAGDITVHGAAVIHRDKYGYVDVATKDTDPGVRTAIGVGLGALLGALAGPIGATAGAAAAAAGTGAAIGAASGGAVGLTSDLVKSDEHEQAAFEGGWVLPRGKSAVIAEVSEQWSTPIDNMAAKLGGTVYRKSKGDIRNDMWFDADYPEYLYPYDYEPQYA